ncbi:MAG: pectin acetylesterase-family hydrolase [Bacteroidota bacterium]
MTRSFFFPLFISFLLLAMGCDKEVPTVITADFMASQLTVEEGDSIDFTDLSTGDPTSWTWTFEGGEPANSTEPNPTVTYTVAGSYEVSLTVNNGEAEGTETKAGYITVTEKPVPFQELYDQGIDRYLGVFTPSSSAPRPQGVTEHTFTGIDAPICFTGNEFSMFTRDGSSNSLLIFLQGGGFCSPVACGATPTGIPFLPLGVIDPSDPQNPTATYNVGYVPYCDGSGMMGDNEVDSDGDGINDRFFKGIQNLSASLDVIVQTYPSPDKIVLAGQSAGGFAVHAALPLVRKLYPDVKIIVINDAGVGISSAGVLPMLFDYWNANAFLPASCGNCIGTDGNLTDYHAYQLSQDANFTLAYTSSKQDSVIAAGMGAMAHELELIEATNELNAAYPVRFQGLIGNGEYHTTIMRDFHRPIGTTTVSQWVADMINESENWTTVIE